MAGLAAAGPVPRRDGGTGFAVGCCAALAAYNNLAGLHPWHRRWYPLLNGCAAGALLAAAAASGLTAADTGLGRARLLPGLRLGTAAAAAAAGGWLALAAVPAARPLLRDERIAGLSGRQVAYQVLVRIPVGTVLWEETAFRGVLQAALHRVLPEAAAIALTSGVFGIWHIRPSVEALRVNGLAGGRAAALAGAVSAVAATAAAGLLLSLLRARSGSLAAPVLLHLAANCGGALAAWALARPRAGRPRRR
jgi:membrane protease YdiL (CAAX protease family)